MSKTAVRISDNPPPKAVSVPTKPRRADRGPIRKALDGLASLRLTVVLFSLSLVLVFCGTLAQVEVGIWTAVNEYFRSAYVWIPFQLFVRFGQVFFGVPHTARLPGSFPFPGGWLIGGLLLANLLAAHAVRFKLSWKRSGILTLHAGLIILMLSELVTGLFAIEGNMTIEQNGSSNFIEEHRATELAIVDSSDSKTDAVVVIPDRFLKRPGPVQHQELPVDVEVLRFFRNSELPKEIPPGTDNPATAGAGRSVVAIERAEVSGTSKEQKVDTPSTYVTFKRKGTGEVLGTYLLSIWLNPQPLSVDGKTYDVSLRFKRTYKPYTIHLLKFSHDIYIGTETPKNFSSLVRLDDPTREEHREVLISMNEPLRYRGETFYQSSFLEGDRGTILQVVRNPGWLMPYIACAMVSVGMIFHFGLHLIGFLRLRATQ
ncbi:MAG TPA: cytochrome c biogenesis protein ResB [Gemmataceae bacterium]|nr:cytochrome c biogenesis protein ResB [Gemmataceae bacterium]